jgi:hypothetical protein
MRGQTRVPCPATTHLSALWCESKRWPLAREVLLRRRLTPLEVVWRSSDPPVHYMPITCACGESERGLAYTCLVGPGRFFISTPIRPPHTRRACPTPGAYGGKAKPSDRRNTGGFAVGAKSQQIEARAAQPKRTAKISASIVCVRNGSIALRLLLGLLLHNATP